MNGLNFSIILNKLLEVDPVSGFYFNILSLFQRCYKIVGKD